MTTAIDTSRPNISRVYDYILGGRHNFEIDRAAAQQILMMVPSYPAWARLNRWYLQLVAQMWHRQGYTSVLDLGSGMPTQHYFHTIMTGARVLYCDNDPVTVAYAQEVLAANSQTHYIEGDIRSLAPVLAEADRHFGGERWVGIGCIDLAYLFDDAELGAMLRELHAWAAPGSALAVSFPLSNAPAEDVDRALQPFRLAGMAPIVRTLEQFVAVAAPWRVSAVRPLHEWVGVEKQFDPRDTLAQTAEMYGAMLVREG